MDRLSISIQHGKEVTIAILHEAQPHYKATSYQLPIAAHKNIHSCHSLRYLVELQVVGAAIGHGGEIDWPSPEPLRAGF
jgi:hypothetical protein